MKLIYGLVALTITLLAVGCADTQARKDDSLARAGRYESPVLRHDH